MDTSLDHFDADDLALIKTLESDGDGSTETSGNTDTTTSQQAGTQQSASSAQGGSDGSGAATSGNDVQGAAAGQGAGEQGSAATEQASHGGNVTAALRASRRAERRATQEAERLRRELEEVKAKLPAGATNADGELDESLAQDFPQIAAALKKRDELIADLSGRIKAADQAAAGTQADAEFVPPLQPAAVQEVIDEIPSLLAMQHNPDQTGWKLAIGYDAVLVNHPKWASKTAAERFAEAARLAEVELATSTTPQGAAPTAAQQAEAARQKAAQAVANAGRRQPETLSDFGGAASESEGSNLARFSKMSDADIEAELLRGG